MKEVRGTVVLETLEEITDPKHTVLLIIDIQNDSSSPKGLRASRGRDISRARKIIPNVKKVLEEARQLGLLIIFMKFARSRDGSCESGIQLRFNEKVSGIPKEVSIIPDAVSCVEGTWGYEVVDELAPGPNELQLVKYRTSSFVGTPLDMILKNRGIQSAVVVGMATEGCVEGTVRDLHQHDYYPVVLSDCVSSSRQDLHEAALLIMAHRWDVITSDELLRVWHSASVTREDQPIGKAGTRLESGATR